MACTQDTLLILYANAIHSITPGFFGAIMWLEMWLLLLVACGSLMKKCVHCRSPIEKMVSFVVCCGGQRKSNAEVL